jgi:hypothetical protein
VGSKTILSLVRFASLSPLGHREEVERLLPHLRLRSSIKRGQVLAAVAAQEEVVSSNDRYEDVAIAPMKGKQEAGRGGGGVFLIICWILFPSLYLVSALTQYGCSRARATA